MKKIFSLICLIIGLSASAQVGVGTTTPNARLDVAAADPSNPTNLDGLIIPRVQSLPTGMTANQNGMLTYKTVASTGSPIGMYIYFHPTGWAYVNSDFTITPDLWTKTGTVISPATAGDDLEFNNSNSSIEFPAVSTSAPPMIKMFSSGTSNATRMVIAHSDGFSSFGLRYTDAGDYFSITGSGETIRLNTFGTNPLTVFGSATFGTSGNQYTLPAADGNAGEVITTDGSGNTNWSSTSAFTNPQFPDGFRNATPLTRNDTQGTYTVPSGRNFYITAFYKRTGTTSLRVNGVQIINDLGTRNDGNLENPIIVGSGQVLSLSAIIINGFFVICQLNSNTKKST
ncbi:MAG: hypothetical protein AAF688_13165, partial [Bacteroidota bacterium]